VKALVVSLSIPFIGRPHYSEARNIPSIGYEETKARKGSSLAWNIPFIYKLHDLEHLQLGDALAFPTKNVLQQRVHTFAEKKTM